MTPPDAPRPRQVLPVALLRLASDERLVEQVRTGSDRAFEAIFDRHQRPVLAFCRQMLGSQADAEDALQHTFFCAYRDLKRSDRSIALRPWLYAIARHRCLSVLRGRRERPVDELPEPVGDHLDALIGRREDLRATLADIAQLPDDQRAALVLAKLGDVSHDEIARVIGCRREKVKALVFQARTALEHDRAARDASCAAIRDRLGIGGGGPRTAVVRRHLRDCASCRAFHTQLRAKRGALGLLFPGIGFKRAVLAALPGLGGGGGAVTVGAMGGGGLAVAAVAAVAIAAGGDGAPATSASDRGDAVRRAPVAHERGRRVAAVAARPTPARREPTAVRRVRSGTAAAVRLRAELRAVANDRPRQSAAPDPAPERIAAEHPDPDPPAAERPGTVVAVAGADGDPPATRGSGGPQEPARQSDRRTPSERPHPPWGESDHGPLAAPPGDGGTPPGHDGAPGPPSNIELPATAAGPPDHATGRERAAEVKPPPLEPVAVG